MYSKTQNLSHEKISGRVSKIFIDFLYLDVQFFILADTEGIGSTSKRAI